MLHPSDEDLSLGTPRAGFDPMFEQQIEVGIGGILHAAVGVMHQAWRGLAQVDGLAQSGDCQPRIELLVQRPAQHPAAEIVGAIYRGSRWPYRQPIDAWSVMLEGERGTMANVTIWVGVLLEVLGIWMYVKTGSAHPTALIPTWFGIVLSITGVLAKSEDPKRRMLWMHIAVTVGLLGFLFPGGRGGMEVMEAHCKGVPLAHPEAVYEQFAMALICLVFVGLCVGSFITTRRVRLVMD